MGRPDDRDSFVSACPHLPRPRKHGYVNRQSARRLAQASIEKGALLAWFEQVSAQAESSGASMVLRADLRPHRNLGRWLDRERVDGAGKSALVVGCGLGDDPEELSRRGFHATAFEIWASAFAMAAERFSSTEIDHLAADLSTRQRIGREGTTWPTKPVRFRIFPAGCGGKRWVDWQRSSRRAAFCC